MVSQQRDEVKSNSNVGTSKAYTPDRLNTLSTFGFRGEGQSPVSCFG